MGWNNEHPSIFSVGCATDAAGHSKLSVSLQPLVFCSLQGVQIHALIDTGSMKSIISSRVFQRINETTAHTKQPSSTIRTISNPCVSIAGQPLHSSFSIAASSSFPGSICVY